MKRIKLTVAYDGTNYAGWQRQKNAMTIQEKIEDSCYSIFSKKIQIIGASRTDTGVHALGQVAVMDVNTIIPILKIPLALNANLPKDIVIRDAIIVSSKFHPRYHAINKTYTYKIVNQPFPIPQFRQYTYFYSKKLDVYKMQQACNYFIGRHDFKAFCSTGSSVQSTVREIYTCVACYEDGIITININGNGFLYNMVRIIVGTLIDVGLGKTEPERIKEIISIKDRTKAGATVPSRGLTLEKIDFGV